MQDLFAGEDKRRLVCPKCSHVQVLYQRFTDVGLVRAADQSVSQENVLAKSRLAKYAPVTVDGFVCQMCENSLGVRQETSLLRGALS